MQVWEAALNLHAHKQYDQAAVASGLLPIRQPMALVFQKFLSAGGFWRPYLTYISISIMYALVAGGLVSFVEPLAAGSGIAEVKTYLNGVHIRGLLAVRLRPWFGLICTFGSTSPGALCITLLDTLRV